MNTLTTTLKTGFAPLPDGTRKLSMQDAQHISGGTSMADATIAGAYVVEAGMVAMLVAKGCMIGGPLGGVAVLGAWAFGHFIVGPRIRGDG